ncbi:MAG: hypothetical protein KTR24_11475, partial [Saprospiraceae bacterium]|nr:hypothetical protein [Saprospiraceae bacterium]
MLITVWWMVGCASLPAQALQVSTFNTKVSPDLGVVVAYAPTRQILDHLTARGIVIHSDQDPIVLCAVDYLGIANEGLDLWKKELATAAQTTPDRVWVSALHQHDGLRCDLTTERVMEEYGLGGTRYDVPTILESIKRTAKAVKKAVRKPKPITHLGFGKAKVEKVASNRRLLDAEADTLVLMRWSKSQDSIAIAAPEGLIDPWLKSVSFWHKDQARAVLSYYATHPQSYYGFGDVTSEFVGLARKVRERKTRTRHVHFNGASGNIAAGKYNDGSKEMRPILAHRMEEGMRKSWESTEKKPVDATALEWKTTSVQLPLGDHLIESELRAMLSHDALLNMKKFVAAKHLAWLLRHQEGVKTELALLKMGSVWVLHLPGELFIEYQLAAQEMVPHVELCVVAYGEYGPGYIGTKRAYAQGGYETSER